MGTRRNFSAEFKAKIALEALVGDKTLHDRTMEATRQGESSRGVRQEDVSWCCGPRGGGEGAARQDRPAGGSLRSLSRGRRAAMIEANHPRLSVVRQCELVSIARSWHYYAGKGESALNLKLMRLIDEQFLTTPWYGSRQGYGVGRKRIRRLIRQMGLAPIYRKPRTSTPHPAHRIYPYLLRHVRIDRPNQVWCADITYIPMQRGFQYLVAIMDWATRTVLSWRLSNTLDSDFCTEALEEALAKYGRPKIFNTDQGSQFTSQEFTEVLKRAGVRISMDGKGRWMDNIFIERLWRSLKYECVYLHDFEDGPQARQTIGTWIRYYNEERPHSTHADDRTPMEEYARRRAA